MIAFRAHKNFTHQSGVTPQVYNQVTLPCEDYDCGGRYSNNAWTPVSEESNLVIFSGQIWIQNDGVPGLPYNGTELLVARIIKNGNPSTGVTIGTGVASKGTFSDDWTMTLSMQDIAQAGDCYTLWCYCYDSDAVIDGHPLHTFWCGAVVN